MQEDYIKIKIQPNGYWKIQIMLDNHIYESWESFNLLQNAEDRKKELEKFFSDLEITYT